MSQLTTNTATIDELITIANNLPDAGSGGEDISSETAQYTTLLTDLETAIDALPDAGSGGGGGSVETCTVTIHDNLFLEVSYTAADGTMVTYDGIHYNQGTCSLNVRKNTILYGTGEPIIGGVAITGDATALFLEMTSRAVTCVLSVTGNCSISINGF